MKPNKSNIKVKASAPKRTKKEARMQEALSLFPTLFGIEPDEGPQIVDKFGNPISSSDEPKILDKYGDDFDIRSVMTDADDPDTGLIRDLRIDDRDFKAARNYYDYAFNIIGKDAHPPWLVQMWIGLMLFAEVCPCCSDKRWFDLSYVVESVDKSMPSEAITEHLRLLVNGTCPKCKRHKYELITKHGLKAYVELVNVLGQRSGKSASAASYSSYVAHRYLKFPRIAQMTKSMQSSTELTGTFVSITFAKAFALLWTPFYNIIRDSRWFQDYHAMLTDHGRRNGVELFRVKDEFIKYFHKGLRFYPTHPNGNILRGDTRILGAIDELGLFPLPTGDDSEDEHSARANADEAHKSLTNSLVTVQGALHAMLAQGYNPPPCVMLGVSSPMSMRDKVMRLLADSKSDEGRDHILGVNLPTWKVNPFLERSSPVIALAYARNPEKAERDFGANPPRVHSAFIHRNTIKHELFTVPPAASLTYAYDQPGFLYGRMDKIRQVLYPSLVSIDAGSTNNSFCITAGHFNFDTQKTECTVMLECMPHEGRRIDFNLIYTHVILPVCQWTSAVALLADQWQSLDILHRAKADMGNYPDGKPKCLTRQYSPRRKDFDTMVSMMESGNMLFPQLSKPEYTAVMEGDIQDFRVLNGKPIQHFALQLVTIRDIGPSKPPTKGEGYTDDLVRASVLLTKIHEPVVMARLVEGRKYMNTSGGNRRNPGPVVVGRSGRRY